MKELRVLFIGNSHTYFNDMPEVFKMITEAGQGIKVEVSMQAHPGVTYNWHLSQEAELRFALIHGRYDYVFLQQAAHTPRPDPEDTIRDGKKLIELVKKCGSTPIIVLPWAEKRFPENQAIMYDTYGKLAKETNTKYSPVGNIFERVLNENPDINLYWFDGEHCSPYGTYVNACCAYTLIFGESPVGLPSRGIDHIQGKEENMIGIKQLYLEYSKDQSNKELLNKFMEEYKKCFPPIWEKDKLYVNLDKDKALVLQQMIWDKYLSINR